MRATGQDPEITRHAASFLLILMWGLVPLIAASVLRIFVSALGRPTIATAIPFLALFVHALGHWPLVLGHPGMPPLGLPGPGLPRVPPCPVMAPPSAVGIKRHD